MSVRAVAPIVGIGASAGGLEDLDRFFGQVPPDSGLSFVVVLHLDPAHKGHLAERLQRCTTLQVEQVDESVRVSPDHVYLIAPNTGLSLRQGVLHRVGPAPMHGQHLPIDVFFRSLAQDRQEHSIGLVLSGMGRDGTLGLCAIKDAGGLTLVQDPAEARFDDMPRSAIAAGLADIVAPAEDLYGQLQACLRQARPPRPQRAVPPPSAMPDDLDTVIILLRNHTGHDFSLYKRSTLQRRVERRQRLHQLDEIAHYVRYLQDNPLEREQLFKEFLIGVTSFFRDPAAWDHLRDVVIPELLERRPSGAQIRAWVAGCSTGEEAYSLGIVFREAIERLSPPQSHSLQIFATDLDPVAIARARQGFYPLSIAADVSPERLQRFFTQENGSGYRIGKEVRELVIFAEQNVIQDPPFTRIDLIICRNLLIYMKMELQRQLLSLFHYSLNPGAVLFLGSAETVSGSGECFHTLDSKWRFFRRETPSLGQAPMHFNFPTLKALPANTATMTEGTQPIDLKALLNQVLLERVTPVTILANPHGEILYTTGRTGQYLEPPVGHASLNLFVMAREGLREVLPGLCRQAQKQPEGEPVLQRSVHVRTNGSFQWVDVAVHDLRDPAPLRGMLLVVFNEAPEPATKRRRTHRSGTAQPSAPEEREIQRLREALQSTREQMQTSQEELKSANEELQSTNEELQSTNEELTTSKEEMQSLNEELQTVNIELQAKVDDLSRVNDDMKNLLDSTEIATLFLEEDLRIRRFTSQAAKLINLIPGDVGRPVTQIASELLYPELAQDVAEVLRTLVFSEKLIGTQDGRWFNARILPYSTLDNRIDGVVVTLVDMTKAKRLENELRQALKELSRLAGVSATDQGGDAATNPPKHDDPSAVADA